jgi:TRAP-type transport system small permease protein
VQTQEIVYLLFPWAVFLIAINITANHDHLSINFFRNLLPSKIQKIIIYFCDIVNLIFVIYMFIAGVNITRATMISKSSILAIPRSWFYLSMPIAFAGMITILTLEFIQKIKSDIKK